MLRSIFFAAVLAAPLFAMAEDGADPSLQWRDCSVDADCIAVQGTCDLTAVNIRYKDEAVPYYRELAKRANCIVKFWEPKHGMIPECKPLAGSEPARAKRDEANPGPHAYSESFSHGTCAMVPKPQK